MFTTIFVGAAAAAARSASSRHSVAWCTSARRSGRSGQRAALTFVAARSAWARARAAPGSFGFRPRSLRPLAASSVARSERAASAARAAASSASTSDSAACRRDRLDRRLVLCPEAGDRREVGDEVHADHPECEVRAARRLDRPRGAHARRVGVEQGGEHHLRVVGRPSCTLGRVLIIERGGVEEADRVDQEVGEVALLEPVEHARRKEEQLLTVTTHIPICHDEIIVDNVNYGNDYLFLKGRHPISVCLHLNTERLIPMCRAEHFATA